MKNISKSIDEFVSKRNSEKFIFTAGPASLASANLKGLRSCFGRGDEDYLEVEKDVLEKLKKISGHREIVRMQGSASIALEIMIVNFLYGSVLIVDSGFYSKRLMDMINYSKNSNKYIKNVDSISWNKISTIEGKYDWIVSCSTETSCGLKIPIDLLHKLSKRLSSKLMLDATASIGLEDNHSLADVIAYSSCKGLFGLTGAAFIAFNEYPDTKIDSFYLNLFNHSNKKMTGPYHSILSMELILNDYLYYKTAVFQNKKAFINRFKEFLIYPDKNQPLLCTYVNCKIISKDKRAILYNPRSDLPGSVVCHLGEIHLGSNAKGNIINSIDMIC